MRPVTETSIPSADQSLDEETPVTAATETEDAAGEAR